MLSFNVGHSVCRIQQSVHIARVEALYVSSTNQTELCLTRNLVKLCSAALSV